MPTICFSQESINVEDFFNFGISAFNISENEYKSGELTFPWIEEYEFRTRTRDFEFEKQEYTLRLSPSTPGKRKAQKALSETINRTPDIEYKELRCNHVRIIYEDWLALFMIDQTLSILNKHGAILFDKQTIYNRMAGIYDFDLQKLVKLQTNLNDIKIDKDDLEMERSLIEEKYGINSKEYDFSNFITMEGLAQKLENFIQGEIEVEDEMAIYEQDLITKEVALEKAEDKQILDFAQIRYEGPHSDFLQKRISLGIGLRIPNSGNRLLKIQELELEYAAIEHEKERKELRLKEKLVRLEKQLKSKIQSVRNFSSTVEKERTQLKSLGDRIAQKEGFSPIILLDIEERHIETQLKELKLSEDLLSDYIDYLHESGRICSEYLGLQLITD